MKNYSANQLMLVVVVLALLGGLVYFGAINPHRLGPDHSELFHRVLQGEGITLESVGQGQYPNYCPPEQLAYAFAGTRNGVQVRGLVCLDTYRQTGYVIYR